MTNPDERAAFIEEMGIYFESLGLTRMAGRIQGYLMVTEKNLVSFDELTQVLQASKSSISNNLKALVSTGFLKPLTLPGDRKTYYSLWPDIDWSQYYRQRMSQIEKLKDLFKKGLELRSDKNDKPSGWLNESIEFYEWLLREFPETLQKWNELKKNRN